MVRCTCARHHDRRPPAPTPAPRALRRCARPRPGRDRARALRPRAPPGPAYEARARARTRVPLATPSQATTEGVAAEPAVTSRPRATTPRVWVTVTEAASGRTSFSRARAAAGRRRRGHQGLAVPRCERVHRAEGDRDEQRERGEAEGEVAGGRPGRSGPGSSGRRRGAAPRRRGRPPVPVQGRTAGPDPQRRARACRPGRTASPADNGSVHVRPTPPARPTR